MAAAEPSLDPAAAPEPALGANLTAEAPNGRRVHPPGPGRATAAPSGLGPPIPDAPIPGSPGAGRSAPYGNVRRRLPIFALAGCVSLVLGLIPFPSQHAVEALVAVGGFVVLTGLTFVLPWPRLPSWLWPSIPVGYIGLVALLRDAQGGDNSGLIYLFFLPVVWLAFYGRRSHLVVGLVAVALALVCPTVFIGPPAYPASEWRLILITLLVSTVVSFTFLFLVSRDRAYLADLAEQSQLARQAAQSADEAREQLASLLRAATETAIIGCDDQGIVTFFSAGAEKLLGSTPEEVVGQRSVFALVDQDELARRGDEVRALIEAADGRRPPSGPESIWTYLHRDGTRRRVSVVLTAQSTDDGRRGYLIVASDATERAKLASERDRLLAAQREVTQTLVDQNSRLRELTKVKDDVVATVSHELRTPLTSILGFVELLLEDDSRRLHDDQAHMLRTIERSALHLLQVADDLLAEPGGSHGLQLQFVDADLVVIAQDSMHEVEETAAERAVTMSLAAPDQLVIHGDPIRLQQLLANLVDNAAKFTEAGGRVLVKLSQHGPLVRVDVLDQGPGIPHPERSQLFESSYRTDSAADLPGAGLGLAIAKSVVDAHDGTIDIVDTDGWSTTFRVHLPVTRHQLATTTTTERVSVASEK